MEQSSQTKPSAFRSFISLLKGLNWPVTMIVIALIITLTETVASLVLPLVTMNLVDNLTTELFNWRILTIILAVFLVQAVAGGVSFYLLTFIGERIVADLRENCGIKCCVYLLAIMIRMKQVQQ